jgi:hypothetical protein
MKPIQVSLDGAILDPQIIDLALLLIDLACVPIKFFFGSAAHGGLTVVRQGLFDGLVDSALTRLAVPSASHGKSQA